MPEGPRRTTLAERAARAGGAVALEQFRTALAVETKADKTDLVTAADRAAQERVIARVREEEPSDSFVCEEEPLSSTAEADVEIRRSVPAAGSVWVVDPIDGTANFVRGARFWATSVAAVVGGDTVGAATSLPAQGDVYAAGSGGVTRNGSSVSVSDRTDPETFAVGLAGRLAEYGPRLESLFYTDAARLGDRRRLGSMQGTLALVAAGGLDAAFVPGTPHPWDSLAGVHLVREAGGTVTDLRGDRWERDSDVLLASNDRAHGEILAVARDAVGDDAD